MTWYYVDAGQQAGPVTDEQLDELARSGKVRPDTLVWREGMTNWVPHGQARPPATPPPSINAPPVGVPESAASAPAASAGGDVVCAECNQVFPKQNTIQYGSVFVCGNCQPRFVQRVQQGGALTAGELDYAGFWIRLVAKFIDGLIVGVVLAIPVFIWLMTTGIAAVGRSNPSMALSWGTQWMIQLLYYGISVAFNAVFLAKFGATPGKMALGLKVITPDGGTISWGRAFGRTFAEILSALICNIGYIIAAFDSQKRALHDHIAWTRVVKTR